jgi:hypothetical protein
MSTTIQLVGALTITIGVALLSLPVGIIVGGAFLLLVGFALGR